MKTFDDRMRSILEKASKEITKQAKRRLITRRVKAITLVSVLVVALILVLFVPYSTALPNVERYASSPYYSVIQAMNKATYRPPKFKNNFFAILGTLSYIGRNASAPDATQPNNSAGAEMYPTPGNANYEEVTDNQVEGVIEGDLIKRSDKYIYYLNDNDLCVYSIGKAETKQVGNFSLDAFMSEMAFKDYNGIFYTSNVEMYLSQDCTTITIVMNSFSKTTDTVTTLVTLDVADPANITQKSYLLFTGSYISSRLVDDDLLLTYNFYAYSKQIDFDDPMTFVPSYGTAGDMRPIDSDDIICPEDPSATRYTVVAKLDSKTLELKDTAALLSYSQQLYVSEDTIYATCAYTDREETGINTYLSRTMTRITGISYSGDDLMVIGGAEVEGTVLNQYSMDQYDDILRVATTTLRRTVKEYGDRETLGVQAGSAEYNCNLYCIDLSDWQVVGSVIGFAPEGEAVTSARFDGLNAYICTAEVIQLTDPVFFFDLSDPANITWTDTGTIDGYSSSLVNFGDYLLGIGFGDSRGLKLEAYREEDGTVVSIGIYERECSFSGKYKSYLIDRENNLVGLPIDDRTDGERYYVLLHFDGYKFQALKHIQTRGSLNSQRAVIIDGWLYVLDGNTCSTEQIW